MPKVLLNGNLVDEANATISVFDRSVLFGDAIYEVCAVYDGKLFAFEPHWQRAQAGAQEIELSLPVTGEELKTDLERLIAANSPGVGGVYFQITRGAAPRTHYLPKDAQPNWFAFTLGPVTPPEAAAAITFPDMRWSMCHVKTVCLLPNSLAKETARRARVREAILVRNGLVTEASSSNVFAVLGGELYTYPVAGILSGITRRLVIELARELGIPVHEQALTLTRFKTADEIFITGTLSEVIPITELDGVPVGDGKVGPIADRLRRAYHDYVVQATR